MSLFGRFIKLIRGNILAIEKKCQDPIKELDLLIEDLDTDIYDASMGLAPIIGSNRQLKKTIDNDKEKLNTIEESVNLAITKGNDNEAKDKAISYSVAKEALLENIALYEDNEKIIEDAKDKIEMMKLKKSRLEAYRARCKTRQLSADVTTKLNKILIASKDGNIADIEVPAIEQALRDKEAVALGLETLSGDIKGDIISGEEALAQFKKEHNK